MALTDTEGLALNRRVEAILGDDLSCFLPDGSERIGRILEAVHDWLRPNIMGIGRPPQPWFYSTMDEWDWSHRDGQPWQADIERHVAEWRAAPRPFCSDFNLCMNELWPKLREITAKSVGGRRFDIKLTEAVDGGDYTGWYVESYQWSAYCSEQYEIVECVSTSATPAEAIVRTYLEALESRVRLADE